MRLSRLFIVVLRLILGLYLLIGVLLIYGSALASSLLPYGLNPGSPSISLEMLLLLSGLGVIAFASLERIKIWTVLVSLGLISTIVSWARVVSNSPPPGVCAILFHNYGFPFPWYRVASFYQPPSLLCLFPAFVAGTRIDGMLFILDAIFYVGLYLAALEVFRGVGLFYQKIPTGRNPRISA